MLETSSVTKWILFWHVQKEMKTSALEQTRYWIRIAVSPLAVPAANLQHCIFLSGLY